jgi:predicted porin
MKEITMISEKSNRLALRAALAVVAMAASAAATAQSSVNIYGILDAAVELNNVGTGTGKRLVSGGTAGSRLGFRGVEDLGGGLSAVFKLEAGLNIDDGTFGQGGRAFGRESTVSLASRDRGTLTFGRIPLPYYLFSFYVDAFEVGKPGGFVTLTRNASTGQRQIVPELATARADNSVQYTSPNIAGFEARAQYAFGEGSTSLGPMVGGSLRYTNGPVDLVAVGMRQKAASSGTGHSDAQMFGGNYTFAGGPKVYVGYTREANSCSTCTGALARIAGLTATGAGDFRLINVGVRMPFGPWTAIGQAVRVQDRSSYAVNPGSRDATWLGAGVEYNLSKRTMLYSGFGTIGNRNGSAYNLGTGGAQALAASIVGSGGNARAKTLALGVLHRF